MKAAELTRTGIGLPAYYNDEVIVPALMSRGLTLEDARDYNIIGCVEPQKSGKTDEISEVLMDAGSAVSGCGPAFAYMFIEALADGAVECGLPRSKAIGYAAQMLIGSARMVIESGEHPEKLKDAVCSPGGSTIAGVRALEEGAFRACAINAVKASFDKTKILGNS